MAKKKKAPAWRGVFLRALRRTGNVRVSAAEAGVDPGTAYDHRIKDAGFAAAWAAMLEKAKNAPRPCSGRAGKGPGLVARRSKRHGVQLVQAGEGRWSVEADAAFFAALGRTACVRRAAAACGFSTNALYKRREAYPEFAERWRAVEEEAKQRIPALLAAATIASLDPDSAAGPDGKGKGGGRLPRINVDQAIAISRLKGSGGQGGGQGRRGHVSRVATDEEVREALTKRLTVYGIRVRKELIAAEWTEHEGHMIPPGWAKTAL